MTYDICSDPLNWLDSNSLSDKISLDEIVKYDDNIDKNKKRILVVDKIDNVILNQKLRNILTSLNKLKKSKYKINFFYIAHYLTLILIFFYIYIKIYC